MRRFSVGICVNYAENKLDYVDKFQQLTKLIIKPLQCTIHGETKSPSTSYPQFERIIFANFDICLISFCGRRGGLMVSVLDSGASGPGSSPGRGHCVVFLGKTLNSHSASLHPGV